MCVWAPGQASPRRREILSDGAGWPVHAALQRDGFVEAATFAEWFAGEDITDALRAFGSASVRGSELVQRQEKSFRFKVSDSNLGMPLGDAFGVVEARKRELCMSHYCALSGTTLEQIFNTIAAAAEAGWPCQPACTA